MSHVWVPACLVLGTGHHRAIGAGLPPHALTFPRISQSFLSGLPSGMEESNFLKLAIKEFLTLPKAC